MNYKYNILIGRFSASGSGSNSVVYFTHNKQDAIKKFNILVNNEKKDIKNWHLRNNEYIEILLINNNINDYDDSIIKRKILKDLQ